MAAAVAVCVMTCGRRGVVDNIFGFFSVWGVKTIKHVYTTKRELVEAAFFPYIQWPQAPML